MEIVCSALIDTSLMKTPVKKLMCSAKHMTSKQVPVKAAILGSALNFLMENAKTDSHSIIIHEMIL